MSEKIFFKYSKTWKLEHFEKPGSQKVTKNLFLQTTRVKKEIFANGFRRRV